MDFDLIGRDCINKTVKTCFPIHKAERKYDTIRDIKNRLAIPKGAFGTGAMVPFVLQAET